MKQIKYFILFSLLISMYSCELDNFDAPDATIKGNFYDNETGKLIEQDIINGTKIKYIELGWENPEIQQMVLKCDGTYQNKLMFSGNYDFYFEESNFVPPVRISEYAIKKGDNTLDFTVQPYIRITGSVIKKEGNYIVAKFTIAPSVLTNVESIGLFAHSDYAVGNELKLAESKIIINSLVSGSKSYTLQIDTTSGDGAKLEKGKTYYFRVGARINIAGAKYNYAPSLQITI